MGKLAKLVWEGVMPTIQQKPLPYTCLTISSPQKALWAASWLLFSCSFFGKRPAISSYRSADHTPQQTPELLSNFPPDLSQLKPQSSSLTTRPIGAQ